MNLELIGMVWLRVEKRCDIVLRERTPWYGHGLPDVLGVTPARYLVELEIKRSVSDFRADGQKHHRKHRQLLIDRQPRQFYYFVPDSIAQKVEPEIPEWAGLMHVGESTFGQAAVIKQAPVNKESPRLTVREYLNLFHMLTNHLLSSETARDYERNKFLNGHQPYQNPNAVYFDI